MVDPNKIIALLKELPGRDLASLRKKLGSKYPELKTEKFITANGLVATTLKKFDVGALDHRGLNDQLKLMHVQALADKPEVLKYVRKLSLEMEQKVGLLLKADKAQEKVKPATVQQPTAPAPIIKPPVPAFKATSKTTAKPLAVQPAPPKKRKMRVAAREDSGLMVLVAAGLQVSTSVAYEPNAMVIRVSGDQKTLNSLMISIKPRP